MMFAKVQWSLVLAVGLCMFGSGVTTPLAAAPARVSEADFSYVAPPGWTVAPFPGAKYHVAYARPTGGFAPNLNFVVESAGVPLARYAQLNTQQMNLHFPGFHLQSQTPFITASGLRGIKIVAQTKPQGKVLQQVFFMFSGHGSKKFVGTASTLASDGAKYDRAVDAAMKTFIVK